MESKGIDKLRAVTSPIPSITICPICNGILQQAVMCDNCDNCFCSACIDSYSHDHAGACRCCSSFVRRAFKPASAIGRALNELRFYCVHRKAGCVQVLPYSALQSHEQDCGFRTVLCPNDGCGSPMLIVNMEYHLSVCEYRLVGCRFCGNKFSKKSLETHESGCDWMLVQCESCAQRFPKKDLPVHTLACGEASIACPDCDTSFLRKDKSKHNCIKALKTEITGLRKRLERLESLLLFQDGTSHQGEEKRQESQYSWTDGAVVLKAAKTGWRSATTGRLLPQFFLAKIRIQELDGGEVALGVARESAEERPDYIGWTEGQYGIMGGKTAGCGKVQCKHAVEKYSDCGIKEGDVVTVRYDGTRTLSFDINGREQGAAFGDVEGPFYLAASVRSPNASVEILEISSLKNSWT